MIMMDVTTIGEPESAGGSGIDTMSRIAVLIPCYNEEISIGKVIDDFRAELPGADIVVFDNCSSDATSEIAAAHGARVIREPRKGKGFVVERMLSEVKSEWMIMVDGDDTYPASAVHQLLKPLRGGDADMVVGARLQVYGDGSFRPLHVFGNKLVRSLVNWLGSANLSDIMSGYRAMNRRVAERIPVTARGFEVETDLTVHALYYGLKIVEVAVPYRTRPPGSESKLRTFEDGSLVLWRIFNLFRSFRPLAFFTCIAMLLFAAGVVAGIPPVLEYINRPDHYISRVPLAILATGLMLLSAGSLLTGIVLHSINSQLRELHNVLVRSVR